MNDIIKKSESSLKARNIIIENMFFNRKGIISDSINFKSKLRRDINQIDNNLYKVALVIDMNSENDEVKLSVKISGVFELDDEYSEEIKERLIKRNTVAILFPYLRSQITLLTSQPEFKPIVLPAININALLDDLEKQ